MKEYEMDRGCSMLEREREREKRREMHTDFW
jgi:hypothetical protein